MEAPAARNDVFRHIARAIESVLMQQTDFEYEILISEDFSTDSTRDIVIGYQARHPDKIRFLLSEENLNDNSVVLRGIRAARGEYVALLDGDDYWMSPQKLQKQVQFLDGHPECSMCFHECAILSEDPTDAGHTCSPIKLFFSLNDLLEGNFVTTCSVMFRLAALGNVPDWYTGCVFGDWPLYILLSQQGMVGYLPDCLAVYRIHSGGQWSGLPEGRRIEQLASFYARLRSHLGPRYDRFLRRITSSHYLSYARRSHLRGERAAAETLARLGLVQNPYNWRLLLLLYAPAVYDGIAFLKHRIVGCPPDVRGIARRAATD
ncbi:MAG: glycosyltransferase [Terriglobia bacterium]|jgi:glycosyltransferase involved in cell wall biosynthesis